MENTGGAQRGLGLPATSPEEVILAGARASAACGFHSFWLNNPPRAHALATLGRIPPIAPALWLGVGVIPLAQHPVDEIVADVRQNDLPLDRFYLGIGSGASGVRSVADGIVALGAALDCRLVVAALGPRMCRLAGAQADGVLLNWLTPAWAARAVEWVREGAENAGRPLPRIMAYVRVALGEDAIARLEHEAANYEGIPHYASHFHRMGAAAIDTTVTGASPTDIRAGLSAWDGAVHEVVVRAVTASDTADAIRQIVEAARPHD